LKGTLIIFLSVILTETFAQVEITRNAVFSFYQFDTVHGKLQTDKIFFLKNGELDTVKSKLSLDSILWCLQRNPTIVVEIFLSKNSIWGYDYQNSKTGIKQLRSLASYLVNIKKVQTGRITSLGSQCDPFLVSDKDIKNAEEAKIRKKDTTVRTNFRILSRDYRPK